jgi:hypothetical protein
LGEADLLSIKKTENAEGQERGEQWNPDNALWGFYREFPNFMDNVVGKEILDFGFGLGLCQIRTA